MLCIRVLLRFQKYVVLRNMFSCTLCVSKIHTKDIEQSLMLVLQMEFKSATQCNRNRLDAIHNTGQIRLTNTTNGMLQRQ